MASGVYEILNTANGKRYIGSAADFGRRWSAHQSLLSSGKHHSRHLQSAWNKHGAAAFSFRPILTCAPTKQMLEFYEQQLLDKAKPEYNILPTAGSQLGAKRVPGFQVGRVQSVATRSKISAARAGMKCPGVGAANAVRIVSAETRAKMSAAHKGRKQSPEHVAARAAALRGNTNSLGSTRSADAVEKSAAAHRGKKRTPEQRANISKGRRESYARSQASTVTL